MRQRELFEDIVQHFTTKLDPNGFKGQIVTFDRGILPALQDPTRQAAATRGFRSRDDGQCQRAAVQAFFRIRAEEERLVDRFRDPNDPLKLLEAMHKCQAFCPAVDRSVEGYEGLIAAQQCLCATTPRATTSAPSTAGWANCGKRFRLEESAGDSVG